METGPTLKPDKANKGGGRVPEQLLQLAVAGFVAVGGVLLHLPLLRVTPMYPHDPPS